MHMPAFANATFAAALAVCAGATPVAAAADQDIEAGRRIYLQGVLPSNDDLRARVQRDVATAGQQLVCAGCHGRSGMGVGEGQRIAPPVAGSMLYQPREIRRRQLYDTRSFRPAYTDESLAQAIRAGVDPNGRALDPMMPRYALDEADTHRLIAYLKTLSSRISPGVDDTDIHFATIVTEGVEVRDRRAVLDVLDAFFEGKAAETRHERSRAERGPFHMERHYQAYRKWNLHVWELRGPPEAWRSQLERHYDQQPVFAVIGGIGRGSWRPIHEFCEHLRLPCLLPNTDLPVVSDSDYYTVYFSKGIELEAQVLAQHLGGEPSQPVLQVYRDDVRSVRAADELRRALKKRGIELHDWPLADGARLDVARATASKHVDAARLVLWLDANDIASAQVLTAGDDALRTVYLSTTLLGDVAAAAALPLTSDAYAVHLLDLPDDATRRRRALDVWMRAHGIAPSNPPLQANTLFAATLAAQALKHIGSNFYRDYFLERIEHIFDSMVTPSAYPRPSLAPNQRYASKGGYVLRISKGAAGGLTQGREWVVP
jgi:ABC-type branched-subunit amino acid transport system substrate-binding protein